MRAAALIAAVCAGATLALPGGALAQDHSDHVPGHAGHHMEADETGMVMNANDSILPRDCSEVSRDHRFEVRAGSGHARPGHAFAYDTAELAVEPCSRVTVTFVNEDDVRHQWMVHGLPRYLYPGGMFHLEAAGGETRTGTFIVPSDEVTYLVHCDLAQHMEKGMKAQLKVGGGSGDLWSVPGISGDRRASGTWPVSPASIVFSAVLAGMILVMIGRAVLSRRR